MTQPVRLGYLVSHPIQYQAPLLRRLARETDINFTVLFGSDFSARSYKDPGFGTNVAWDVPLLDGYRSRVLPALRDSGSVSVTSPLSRNLLAALRDRSGRAAFDALWVHGYASLNALRAIAAAGALGIPVLLRAESWSGDRPRSPLKRLAKWTFFRGLRPMVAATLPIGSRNAAYWRGSLGDDIPQFLVPYAVDNTFFAQRAASSGDQLLALRTELKLTPDRPIILFASKLQPRKHAGHLVEAVARLTRQLASAPFLLLAGEGEQRHELEQLVAAKQLDNVRFLGFRNQSELPALFALADVFVLPSTHEPWGLIVNEAMAAGCPVVVSSDVGAAPDLVTNGVNGFTFSFGDVPALTAALASVLRCPETSQRMGQASADRMATWDLEADIRGLREALAFVTHRLRP